MNEDKRIKKETNKSTNNSLFDFEDENLGLRSINFFGSNRKVEYPSSKWEVTPRTATQTNRLKWDQTPLGVIKIETESFLSNKIRSTETGWDKTAKEDDGFMLSKDLTINEINMLLPITGYTIYNYKTWDSTELVELSTYGDFNEKEREFFVPLFQSKDEEEKNIYKCLLTLIKGDRKQKRYAIKRLTKVKNLKLVTEKLILFSMYFELNLKDKERILKIYDVILKKPNIYFQREIIYILTTFVFEPALKKQAFETLKCVFARRFENIEILLNNDILTNDKQLLRHISKVMSLSMLYYGYNRFKSFISFVIKKQEYNLTLMILKAHLHFIKLKDCELSEKLEIYETFKHLFNNKRYLVEISNIISYTISKEKSNNCTVMQLFFYRFLYEIVLNEIYLNLSLKKVKLNIDDKLEILKKNIKIIIDKYEAGLTKINDSYELIMDSNIFLLSSTLEFLSDYEWLIFNDEKYFQLSISVIRSMGYLSKNNKIFSQVVFYFLKHLKIVNINNLKVFDKICHNLDDPHWYLISIFEEIMTPENLKYKKMIVSCFLKNLPNKDIEELLLKKIEIPQISDIIVEILIKLPEYTFNDEFQDSFMESLFVLVKNKHSCVIDSLDVLIDKGNFDPSFVLKIYDLAFKYLDYKDKLDRVCGLKILTKITGFLDKKRLFYLSNIIWEHLNKEDNEILTLNIKLIEQIYIRFRFKSIEEIVSVCLPFLRIKNFEVAESLFSFLTTALLKNTKNAVDPKELMRISYEAVEHMRNWCVKNVYALMEAISNFLPIQDILNILLGYLSSEDNENIKRGVSVAISKLSKCSNFYEILPILLIEYSYHDYNIKLRILKSIIYSMRELANEGIFYVYSLISLVEDCMFDEDIGYRTLGLKLVRSLLKCYDSNTADLDLITHLVNTIWINILETNISIKKEFNLCMETLATITDGSFFFYYLVQGLYHPSKKVKNRYREIYEILNKNGSIDIEIFIDQMLHKESQIK